MKLKPTISLLLLFLATPIPAAANDFTFGGNGSAIAPLKETRIRMVTEDITMVQAPAGWRVTAVYEFKNPTGDEVPVKMGFPEYHCDGETSDCWEGDGRFQYLTTRVRGKEVPLATATIDEKSEWAPSLGTVYTFSVTFAANEKVRVDHSYLLGRTKGIYDESIRYVTRTGSLWNGPIEKATFTIMMPERPWGVRFPAEYTLNNYIESASEVGPLTTLVFTATDWTPSKDLSVTFDGDFAYFEVTKTGCPYTYSFTRDVKKKGLEKAAFTHFGTLTAKGLRVCRNTPFAHHGYPFKSKDLRHLFYGTGPVTRSGSTFFKFMVNDAFDASLLSEAEKLYIEGIKLVEKKRKGGK